MTILPEDRRAETARAFMQWRAAGSRREGDRHLVRLWELCQPEVQLALKDMATREHSDVARWLERRGLSYEEISYDVFPAVKDAAHKYDAEHESGASFSTFAMNYIKGEIARIAKDSPPLAGTKEPAGDLEAQPHEGPHREDEPLDFADSVALVYTFPKSDKSRKSTKQRSIQTNIHPRRSAGSRTALRRSTPKS